MLSASFGIKPDAVIGYSLGETAGFFSTRTWTARDEMLQRIQQSTCLLKSSQGLVHQYKRHGEQMHRLIGPWV